MMPTLVSLVFAVGLTGLLAQTRSIWPILSCGKGEWNNNTLGDNFECLPCPDGSFMDKNNHSYHSCFLCKNYSREIDYVEEWKPCTSKRDAVVISCMDTMKIEYDQSERRYHCTQRRGEDPHSTVTTTALTPSTRTASTPATRAALTPATTDTSIPATTTASTPSTRTASTQATRTASTTATTATSTSTTIAGTKPATTPVSLGTSSLPTNTDNQDLTKCDDIVSEGCLEGEFINKTCLYGIGSVKQSLPCQNCPKYNNMTVCSDTPKKAVDQETVSSELSSFEIAASVIPRLLLLLFVVSCVGMYVYVRASIRTCRSYDEEIGENTSLNKKNEQKSTYTYTKTSEV